MELVEFFGELWRVRNSCFWRKTLPCLDWKTMLTIRQTGFISLKKPAFYVLATVGFLLTIGLVYVGLLSDKNDTQEFSWSISEARKRGTLVSEVEIIPEVLTFDGQKITFEAAWLERRPNKGYALCFRINQGKDVFKGDSSPFFILGDRKGSFQERYGRGWVQFIERLDSADLSALRASLVRNWKDKTQKNIEFLPVLNKV